MRDALQTYLSAASGLPGVTRKRAVAAVRALQAQGGLRSQQVSALAEDLVEQSRANRAATTALVRYEVERALSRVGLAGAEEVAALSARVRALEATVRELQAASRGPVAPAP